MPRSVAILLATLALAVTVPAGAQTRLEQAKALTDKATIQYQVAHFDEALALYSSAYEIYPEPTLLFDIGQCHRMLRNHERAIFFFQGYLREKPDARNRPLVEQLLDDSKRELDKQRAADAEKAEADRRAAEQAQQAAAASPSPELGTGQTGASDAGPDAATSQGAGHPALRIAGLATAGAGVVLLGTAVYLGLHASSLSNEITQLSAQHGTWNDQYASDYDSGKSAATAATVLYVVGGVVLATGGVLTYLGWPRRGAETRPAAALAPTPGGGSFVVVGRF